MSKKIVKAIFPGGIGEIEISQERADQIRRLQKGILESRAKKVNEGDYFTMSAEKGYAPSQRKDAMQVMECWDGVMTVKCKGGCMTKPYDYFHKIKDVTQFQNVYSYPHHFEDHRTND